ncbi:hypothetical protein Avbf_03776 [Armadillidium vulgare]|nr:hypothetical protein Avbf_03776 [Armadillidium vulgare]
MFYCLMYSSQYDDISSDTVSNNIESYVKYLQNYEKTVCDQPTSKLIAYYFMYIIESIYVLIKYLDCKTIEEPSTCSLGLKFKNLKTGSCKSDELLYKSYVQESIPLLSQILNKLSLCISLDIWISWYDLKAPSIAMFCDEKIDIDDEKTTENSIQTQIAHTVFRIMKMKNKFNNFDEILNLNENKELGNFLNQVAVDPDYDSDIELSTLELIEAIRQGSDNKRKKLMTLLLNRDIFEFKESLSCLEEHMNFVTRSTALLFIKRFIKEAKDVNKPDEWKCIVIDLSKRVTNYDVVNILKEDLNNGHDDVMKTNLFSSEFTQISNQLSHQADTECFNSYLRLCLQSGVDVLKYSIDKVISLSGLSPVFASAFRIVNFICRSKGKNGICLTTNLLMEKLNEGLTLEMESELFAFILEILDKSGEDSLSSDLHESIDVSSSYQNLPVDVNEIFEHLVCSRLKMEKEDEASISLLNLLKVLKKIIQLYSDVILKPKVRLSCVASLIILHNNCCYLDSNNYNLCVQIRNSIEEIIYTLKQFIVRDIGSYEEEFALLKVCICRYDLHCRSMLLLSKFIGEKITPDSNVVVDQIFNCIWKKNQDEDEITIPSCSRVEWIWALYIVTPTLKLFQEVFLILCDKSKQGDSILPLQYCFKSFSVSAIKFADEKLQNEENKFFLFANLFVWWCKAQKAFDCSPEYPVLFLNLLVGLLVDLVREKYIIIENNSDNKPSLVSESVSFEEVHPSQILTNGDNIILGGQDSLTSSQSNLANGINDGKIVNGFEENNGDEAKICNGKTVDKSSITKVTSRNDFNDCINSMIKIFVSCIRPSELTSTVAGKLKLLCEF